MFNSGGAELRCSQSVYESNILDELLSGASLNFDRRKTFHSLTVSPSSLMFNFISTHSTLNEGKSF